jgi:DNA (cytosine-5)-methyltransferase 1
LAAHWMGWKNIMHCEIDPFCNKVMNYHFPNSYQHEDIRATDFTIWRGKLDLITGGWPCQPVSTAGKRKGKDDVRYLWPENIRAVREIQPRIVVGENVRGLTNWQGGVLFDEVQADLEAEGYEVLPFLLPAAGVNAPHRRDRIWFIAYANGHGFGWNKKLEKGHQCLTRWPAFGEFNAYVSSGFAADAGGVGLEGRVYYKNGREKAIGINEGRETAGRNSKTDWQDFPTQSPVCSGDDGVSLGLADIAFSKWRKESIKALGNAIVPQVAYQIFKAIQIMNNETSYQNL